MAKIRWFPDSRPVPAFWVLTRKTHGMDPGGYYAWRPLRWYWEGLVRK